MRKPTCRFEELEVWQKSHALVLRIYKLTRAFPRDELFGLTSQLRRAAASVPANIAEGYARMGRGDKMRMMNIAQGSLDETRYHLILARDLNYADTNEMLDSADEIGRMLDAYIRAIGRASVP